MRGVTAAEAPTTDLRTLLHRLWAAILAHKPLVAAAIVFGVLEALFTKAPFVLIDPLMRVMGEQSGATASAASRTGKERWSDWFAPWFQAQSDTIAGWFGRDAQSPGGPAMNLVLGVALVAAACGLLGAVCIYGVQLTSRFFAIKMVADLRCAVAKHILSLPLRYFGQRRMGELI